MARLELRFLGSFLAISGGSDITGFESNKVRALLAYLAVESDQPQRRERLAGLLWPDWPQQSAMSNLRYALADLRKNLGDRDANPPFLLITRDSLQFNPHSDAWVDVKAFEPGDQEASKPANLSQLQSSIDLYRGEFLEGFSVADSPPFEQWVLARREQFHRRMLQTLFSLTETHAQQGEFEAALRSAYRQVELEPSHEPGQQQLMRLLAMNGQRSAALAQYEACRSILAAELGVEPSHETKRLYEAIRDETLAPTALPPAERLPPATGEPPFKGLQYFDTPDAGLFFGREALTARLIQHIRNMVETHVSEEGSEGCCFLAVVGASGSGKSSVVRAGIVPALQRGEPLEDGTLPPEGSSSWHMHVFTPTAHPLEALAVSLTREAEALTAATQLMDDFAHDPRSLHVFAQRLFAPLDPSLAGQCRLLLIVDQFEELFTLCHSEGERVLFLDNLLTAVQRGGPTQVVVVLRADFYGHCATYPKLRQALCSRQEYIGPMNASELRRAIEEPAHRSGWEFEPGLVDLILRDIGVTEDQPPEPGALPLLEHALLETWKRRSGHTLTLGGYQEAGGVRGAIAKTAESVFTHLNDNEKILARRIFLRLTELGEGTQDTRRRAALDELIPQPDDAPQVEALLKTLADARLITLAEGTAEVAHEALIREWPALRQWLNEDRDGLRLHRRLTETTEAWVKLERDPGELYRGARLVQATEWVEGHLGELNALEGEFLQASQQQAEREAVEREAQRQRELEAARMLAETQQQAARRLRHRAWQLAGALGAALVLVFVAVGLALAANQNAQQRAAQQAIAEEQSRLSRSRELAAAAINNLTKDPQLSLLLSLEAVNTQVTTEAESALHQAVQASHLEKILTSSPEAAGSSGALTHMAYSPDGQLLAAINDQGWLQVFDAGQGRLLYSQRLADPLSDVRELVFFPDGRLAVEGNKEFTILEGASSQEILHGKNDENGTRVWDTTTSQEVLNVTKKGVGYTDPIRIESPSQGLYYLVIYDELENYTVSEISVWNLATHQQVMAVRWNRAAEQSGTPGEYAFSPDGTLFAIPYDYGVVEIWDVASGSLRQKLTGLSPGVINKVAFSPDGSLLAAVGDGNPVKVWELASGKELLSLNGVKMFFSPNGQQLVVSDSNRQVNVWSIAGRRMLNHFLCHPFQTASALRPDGKQLASGGQDGAAYLCEVSPGHELQAWTSDFPVREFGYSPAQALVGIASADNVVRLYDAETGEQRQSVSLPATSQLETFTLTRDGGRFATGEKSLSISKDPYGIGRIWDTATGKELVHNIIPVPPLTDIAFSPDGNKFYIEQVGLVGYELDSASLSILANQPYWLDMTGPAFASMAYSPDGARVALAKVDGRVSIFESHSQTQVMTTTLEGEPTKLIYITDGSRLAVGIRQGKVIILDANTGKEIAVLPGQSAPVTTLAYSPDGTRLATGSADGAVRLWNAKSGNELLQLIRQESAVTFLAFNKDGSRLVSGSADGQIGVLAIRLEEIQSIAQQRLVRGFSAEEMLRYHITAPELERRISFTPSPAQTSVATAAPAPAPTPTPQPTQPNLQPGTAIMAANAGQLVELARAWTGSVNQLAWAPGGKRVAVVSTLGLSVLDVRMLQVIWRQKNASLMVKVAFSPDGSLIATGGDDGWVRLWRAADGQELAVLEGHTMSIIGVAFSPDGSWLASGSSDDTVRLWRVPDGAWVATLANEPYAKGVSAMTFSPDGAWLATGSYDGKIRFWDTSSRTVVREIQASDWSVASLGFSPDGAYLATGSVSLPSKVLRVEDGAEIFPLGENGGLNGGDGVWGINSIVFSPDGSVLAVEKFQILNNMSVFESKIEFWNVANGKVINTLKYPVDIASLAFSPDSRLLAAGMKDGFLIFYGVP